MLFRTFMISATFFTAFGVASLAYASDYPVLCAKNDGGPKDMNCISISNNTKRDVKLNLKCELEKGHYLWTEEISAGKQTQCLDLSEKCKIPQLLDRKKHRAVITVNDEIFWTSCDWPDGT